MQVRPNPIPPKAVFRTPELYFNRETLHRDVRCPRAINQSDIRVDCDCRRCYISSFPNRYSTIVQTLLRITGAGTAVRCMHVHTWYPARDHTILEIVTCLESDMTQVTTDPLLRKAGTT